MCLSNILITEPYMYVLCYKSGNRVKVRNKKKMFSLKCECLRVHISI